MNIGAYAMDSTTFSERRLSKLMLGSAQFGMRYGIANQVGQPSYSDIKAMLSFAADSGVNCIDTAAGYGESENIIGTVLSELGIAKNFFIVTKILPMPKDKALSPYAAEKTIRKSVEQSLRKLHTDCIQLVLFHREADFIYAGVLEELRSSGLIQNFGMSCETWSDTAIDIVSSGRIRALQIPASILDQRYIKARIPIEAKKRNVSIFVRSVFLQGLLLMPAESIPDSLRGVIPVRDRLSALALSAGMSIRELAIRYILGQDGVSSIVIGVERLSQLKENIALFDRGPLPEDLLKMVESETQLLPSAVLSPPLWSK